MQGGWRFYRFDYARYVEIRPNLRSATTPQAFAVLSESPETEAIVDALLEEEISLEEARHAFLQATCCVGEPLWLEQGFPRFISLMGRKRGAEDAAELLGELVAGGKNIEPWHLPSYGLIGYLTPAQTEELHRSYATLLQKRAVRLGKKGRRGGLLGRILGFWKGFFPASPEAEEMLYLLGDQIEEATQQGEGIVVYAE